MLVVVLFSLLYCEVIQPYVTRQTETLASYSSLSFSSLTFKKALHYSLIRDYPEEIDSSFTLSRSVRETKYEAMACEGIVFLHNYNEVPSADYL